MRITTTTTAAAKPQNQMLITLLFMLHPFSPFPNGMD
jgi:hypothetical protein